MALSIVISGVADPTKVPLGGSVTLTASKDASSYAWVVLSKPPGSSAPITNALSKSCSVSLSAEGSYLIQLTINAGTLFTETATCAPAIRELESHERIPALGETTENTDWAQAAVDRILKRVARMEDVGVAVGVLANAIPATGLSNTYQINDVVLVNGKVGLSSGDDARNVPQYAHAWAGSRRYVDGVLGVIEGVVDGSSLAVGKRVRVRHTGLVEGLTGSPLVGDPVYVNNSGRLSLLPGTVVRQVGTVAAAAGGSYDAMISGMSGHTITLLA